MTKQQQKEFFKECLNVLERHFDRLQEQNKIPVVWDGVELRWLINDLAKTLDWSKASNHRKREYNQVVLINNLI